MQPLLIFFRFWFIELFIRNKTTCWTRSKYHCPLNFMGFTLSLEIAWKWGLNLSSTIYACAIKCTKNVLFYDLLNIHVVSFSWLNIKTWPYFFFEDSNPFQNPRHEQYYSARFIMRNGFKIWYVGKSELDWETQIKEILKLNNSKWSLLYQLSVSSIMLNTK